MARSICRSGRLKRSANSSTTITPAAAAASTRGTARAAPGRCCRCSVARLGVDLLIVQPCATPLARSPSSTNDCASSADCAWPDVRPGLAATSDSDRVCVSVRRCSCAGRLGRPQSQPERADDRAQRWHRVRGTRPSTVGSPSTWYRRAERSSSAIWAYMSCVSRVRLHAVGHQPLAGVRQTPHLHRRMQDREQQRSGQDAQTQQQKSIQRLG